MTAQELNEQFIDVYSYVCGILWQRKIFSKDLMNDLYIRLYNKRDLLKITNRKEFAYLCVTTAERIIINQNEHIIYTDPLIEEIYETVCDSGFARAIHNEQVGKKIDYIMQVFEDVTIINKDRRRRVLQLYLQGYSITEIISREHLYKNQNVYNILWAIIRDIQKALHLPQSPPCQNAGILSMYQPGGNNKYIDNV